MKILVVEETCEFRTQMSNILEANNHQVFQAESVAVAIGIIKQHHDLSLMILDLSLPNSSGLELLKLIRENDTTYELPVIVCTANSSPKLVTRGKSLNIMAYLLKPVDTDRLLRLVAQVVHAEHVETMNK